MYEDTRLPVAGAGPTTSTSANNTKTSTWRQVHSLAWHDVRTRWRRGLLWVLYLSILLVFILALAIALSTSTPNNRPTFNDSVACLPDGSFSLDPSKFNFWGYGGFFEITMGYGNFTFTQAKVLDVAWDVVIGRGGQALLALISGNVFARYVSTTMQVAPITFNTFKTVFLARDGATAWGLSRLVRDFSKRKRLPSRLATVFMILTLVFVLVFPTFTSAMSGYSANVEAFVEDQSKRYVPFANFRQLYFEVHDGNKAGLEDETRITSLEIEGEPLLNARSRCASTRASYYADQCELMDDVARYVLEYGIESATNNTTFFGKNRTPVESPSLNITAHYVPFEYLLHLWRQDGRSSNSVQPGPPTKVLTPNGSNLSLTTSSLMMWSSDENSTYDQSYIKQHGRCQPSKTYKWGWSFIQLFLMVTLLTIWAIGTYTLYIRSHIAMRRRGHDGQSSPIAGEYQAIFQLADAMHAQLDTECDKIEKSHVDVSSENELKRRIVKDLKGGSISYKDSLLDSSDTRSELEPWRVSDWLKEEIWWLLLLLGAVLTCLLAPWFFPYLIGAYMLPLQVLFAMYVGQSWKSRIVLLGWLLVGVSLVPTAVMAGMFGV